MFLTCLKALDRKSGKLVTIAEVGSAMAGAADNGKVAIAYQKAVAGDEEGAAFRAKFSSLLFIVENQVRNIHQFPDLPAQAAQAAKEKALQEAVDKLKLAKANTEAQLRKLAEHKQELERAKAGVTSAGGTINDADLPKVPTLQEIADLEKQAQDAASQIETLQTQIAELQSAAKKPEETDPKKSEDPAK